MKVEEAAKYFSVERFDKDSVPDIEALVCPCMLCGSDAIPEEECSRFSSCYECKKKFWVKER